MRNEIIRKKMQKTVLKQGIQINVIQVIDANIELIHKVYGTNVASLSIDGKSNTVKICDDLGFRDRDDLQKLLMNRKHVV